MMKNSKKMKEIRKTKLQNKDCKMTGLKISGEEGGRRLKALRKIGIGEEGDLEGKTGMQDGRIERKMMTRETSAEDRIREETGAMKRRSLMRECKG